MKNFSYFIYLFIFLNINITFSQEDNNNEKLLVYHVFFVKDPGSEYSKELTNVVIDGDKLSKFNGYAYGIHTLSEQDKRKFITVKASNSVCSVPYDDRVELKQNKINVLIYYADKVYDEEGKYLGLGVKIKPIYLTSDLSSASKKVYLFSALDDNNFEVILDKKKLVLNKFSIQEVNLKSKKEKITKSQGDRDKFDDRSDDEKGGFRIKYKNSRPYARLFLNNGNTFFAYFYKIRGKERLSIIDDI